jgi:putative metalloprotease
MLASAMAVLAFGSSAHSQGLGDLLGSAKKVAQAATVTDEQVVAYFSQMSDELDRQNRIAPAKNPYAVRLAKLTTGLSSTMG